MIHTTNLMVSGGMATDESPNDDLAAGEAAAAAAARPTTRKSQIIEEEEDDEDEEIEEVDTFSGAEEEPVSPSELAKPDDSQDGKPSLAPAPDITSSPQRPPRSSSLRVSKPETATSIHSEDDKKDSASLTPVASAK